MKRSLIMIAILVIVSLQGISQTRIISGNVSSAGQEKGPLQGVTVLVKGTTIGTTTDPYGKYSLSVSLDADTLIFSFIGMRTAEVTIGSKSELNIALEQDILELEDVVVTALGITKQNRAVTYAAQNVETENLTQARNVSFMQGLSGKVAGLSLTTSGNGAASNTKIVLRGIRSIAGSSQPIYVVDGVTLAMGRIEGLGGIDGLSPDDIETITVLKGANAAALYGSRANNGAIVINTKSGKGAREGVTSSLGFTYQASTPLILEKVQNIYGQGANGIYSKNATVSWGPKMEGQVVDHWSNDPNYVADDLGGIPTYQYLPQPDNIRDYFQTGQNFTTNLQVNIKSGVSNIAFSYTNTNAEGFCYGDNVKIHNLNLRITSDLTKKLTLDSKINLIREKDSNVFLTGDNYLNPVRYLYILPRNIRTQDMEHYEFINAAGQLRQHFWRPGGDNGSGNPYWQINNCSRPWSDLRAIALLSMKYQISKDLSIQARAGWDGEYSKLEGKINNDTYTMANYGAYYKIYTSTFELNTDALLSYHKSISDFVIDMNAGANYRLYEQDYINGQGAVFNVENMFALANTTAPVPYEGYEKKVVQSVYGFGELSWRNALFLNLTGRNDWSSTLPENSRSYFYPSIGLTTVISDLITLPDFFTNLKLRGSYAEVGNDAAAYSLSRLAKFGMGGVITISPEMPNANLKPERTKSTELGLGIRVIDDRIRLDATVYQTNSYDQLFGNPLPAGSGAATLYQNGADIQNRGLELMIGAVPVNAKSFTWDISVNWSKNTSKVLEIAEGFDVLSLNPTWDMMREYKLVKGQPFGEVYAKGWVRDENGNVIVQSNGLPMITPGFSVRCANFNPDWLGGISNSFTYKDLVFSFLIDARWGGTFVSFTEAVCAGGGILDYTATGREDGTLLFGRDVFPDETGVTSTGEVNTVATRAELFWNNVGGRSNPVGEAFIREATNVRLRETILGYNLPKKLMSKSPFTAARISLVGRNLFFLLNRAEQCDPEIVTGGGNLAEGRESFSFPTTRTYGVSVNVDF